MGTGIFALTVLVGILIVPVALQLYLHRLPVAPACPACRATTRPVPEILLARCLPAFLVTSRSECGRCGWRGRMRWQWAARPAPRRSR